MTILTTQIYHYHSVSVFKMADILHEYSSDKEREKTLYRDKHLILVGFV